MQDSAKARSAVASTITLSRREREAERARQRYAKTRSHKALVAMVNATTRALDAYARLRAPGRTAAARSAS